MTTKTKAEGWTVVNVKHRTMAKLRRLKLIRRQPLNDIVDILVTEELVRHEQQAKSHDPG